MVVYPPGFRVKRKTLRLEMRISTDESKKDETEVTLII